MQIACQNDIDCLIACPKVVIDPPHREFHRNDGHLRNAATLRSRDDAFEFGVFMRINARFREFFSVGLYYQAPPPVGKQVLLRCNSRHGWHVDDLINPHPHYTFHVHWADYDMLSNGESAEKHAVATTEFACYEEALRHFLFTVHVEDADINRYFPETRQLSLFGPGAR
jgi:hypothetical protein